MNHKYFCDSGEAYSLTRLALGNLRFVILSTATVLPLLGACTQKNDAPDKSAAIKAPSSSRSPVPLAITGYNYTNLHIDSFSVDGAGGGNIQLSTPTSGGGGSTCCISYGPRTRLRTVSVEWQTGGCYYHEKSATSGDVFDRLHSYSYKREVEVEPGVPPNPKVIEIHFYPDGSIKAAITAGSWSPRLQLSADREDKSDLTRCPNDKKPNE